MMMIDHYIQEECKWYRNMRNVMKIPLGLFKVRRISEKDLRMAHSVWCESGFDKNKLFSFKVTTRYMKYRLTKFDKKDEKKGMYHI